jgi:hypothetical protein
MMTIEEWESMEKDIKFEFARDNHFAELKDSEMLMSRLGVLEALTPYIGMYFSHRWVRRNILKQTDEDQEIMTIEISEEMANPLYAMAQQNQQAQQGQEQGGQPGQEGGDQGQQQQQSQGDQDDQAPDPNDKIENARHVVQALADVKRKTPGDVKKLRSASMILAKAK